MRQTCHECPYLKISNRKTYTVAHCDKEETKPVIPHRCNEYEDARELTYTHVPTTCTLPADKVKKRDKPAPEKYWGYETIKRKS